MPCWKSCALAIVLFLFVFNVRVYPDGYIDHCIGLPDTGNATKNGTEPSPPSHPAQETVQGEEEIFWSMGRMRWMQLESPEVPTQPTTAATLAFLETLQANKPVHRRQLREPQGPEDHSVVRKTATLIEGLNANTTQPRLACVFNIIGSPAAATEKPRNGTVTIQSQERLEGVTFAAIKCTNGTLKLYGGGLLTPFKSNFTGVQFVEDLSLPGANMRIEDQEMQVVNSSFTNLTSHGNAVLQFVRSTALIQSSIFVNNIQAQSGALMGSNESHLTVRDNTFWNNSGYEVGSIALKNSSAFIDHNTFVSNHGNQGGAILSQTNNNTLNVYISWNVLSGNSASNGGAVFIEGGRLALLFGNQLNKNEAGTNGGAVFILKAPPIMVRNNFTANTARYGGATYVNDVPLMTLEENMWHRNSAEEEGGCLSIQNVPNANLYHEAFSACSSDKGGAVLSTKSVSRISHSGFRGNRANKGGAVFRRVDQGLIEDSFFVDNSAVGPGGIGGALYDLMVIGDVRRTNFTRNAAEDLAGQAFRVKCKGKLSDNNGITPGAWKNAEFEVPLAG